MEIVNDYRFSLGKTELVPIVGGGMGVHFSSPEMALEFCRLGGAGHISDAMIAHASDKRYGSNFTAAKYQRLKEYSGNFDKSKVKFDLEDVRQAQLNHVRSTMDKKQGPGMILVNVMEKLTMADPLETLRVRLNAALDGGIDGVTMSAGLHLQSLKMIEDNRRFRDVKLGIIVSSVRALKIFMRSAARVQRAPDYIVVEGPLAGGHLGFGADWREYDLATIVSEVVAYLKAENFNIPVIAAGGVFTGQDAVGMYKLGAAAVQVATRFVVTKECGIPSSYKQRYFQAHEEDIEVNEYSPTGYLMRMLKSSPCLSSNVAPQCEAFGYLLDGNGKCQYHEAYAKTPCGPDGKKLAVKEKTCLCFHFSKSTCFTCGHNAYRLKDTSRRRPDGSYQLLTVEHVFKDYQFSGSGIVLPEPDFESPEAVSDAEYRREPLVAIAAL